MIQLEIVPILISSLFRLIVVMFLNHKPVMLGVSALAVIMRYELKVSVKSANFNLFLTHHLLHKCIVVFIILPG